MNIIAMSKGINAVVLDKTATTAMTETIVMIAMTVAKSVIVLSIEMVETMVNEITAMIDKGILVPTNAMVNIVMAVVQKAATINVQIIAMAVIVLILVGALTATTIAITTVIMIAVMTDNAVNAA